MTTELCDTCKTGKEHMANYNSWKVEKTMSYSAFIKKERILGDTCIRCMYNGFKGLKAKAIRKIVPDFQAYDNYVKVE
ncbi:MAG: hypothetical protein A2V66_16335 [Ignavibacteria bacterium RBG_13_36_8]|nr:MAG: hypothetical protein A2V66_16335 [Ignavibacteria bacterium RBG_13_36_8]